MSKELDKILAAAADASALIEELSERLDEAKKRLDVLRAQAEKQLQADLAKLAAPAKKTPPKNTRKKDSKIVEFSASPDATRAIYDEAMARS